jgi:SAM-dependent methyltransferase
MTACEPNFCQKACPACGCHGARLFVAGDQDRGRRIKRAFRFYLCSVCRLRFQVVAEQEATSLFADVQDTASFAELPGRRELRCDEDVLRAFRRLGEGRRLLDIGSGDGRFLAAARRQGFDCVGTDVSERLASLARERSRAPVLVGKLPDLDLSPESFDWINLDQVLMYVPNPRAVMQKAADLLRPGGVCRLRENDADSFSARIKGTAYWMYGPTHVNIWTKASVAAVAAAARLRILRIIPGTESSLANWLATARASTFRSRLRDKMLFLLRRLHFFCFSVAADTVYYLRKPGPGVETG